MGGVLEFSNRTLQEFVRDSTGLDIYDDQYNYSSGSKANRLRGFWSAAPDHSVGKLMGDLLDYGVENGKFSAEDQTSLAACRQTVLRLLPQSVGKSAQPEQKPDAQIVNHFYAPVGNVAQNSRDFNQKANIKFYPDDISKLVAELAAHLDELNLDARQKQRAQVQIATLQAEIDGDPDPAILKQAAHTLRNIIEGAVGSLIATAAQPSVWHFIQRVLGQF